MAKLSEKFKPGDRVEDIYDPYSPVYKVIQEADFPPDRDWWWEASHWQLNEVVLVQSELDHTYHIAAADTLALLHTLQQQSGSTMPAPNTEGIKQMFNTPPIVTDPLPCSHKWREYIGLMERFEYCEVCDEKRS